MAEVKLKQASETLDRDVEIAVSNLPIANLSIESLDRIIGGVYPGRLIILSGEPGTGKSTLLNVVKDDLAQQGLPVIYVSLEMSSSQMNAKSLARMSGGVFGTGDIAGSNSNPARKAAIDATTEAYRTLTERIFYIEESVSAAKISETVGRFVREHGEKPVVIVDYLQMLSCSEEKLVSDERLQIKDSVTRLRNMARKYSIPVFAISSVNRQAYDKATASLGNLGGSACVEYTADGVLHLSVEGKGNERTENMGKPVRPVIVSALKNRFGPTGRAYLDFDPQHATFTERVDEYE